MNNAFHKGSVSSPCTLCGQTRLRAIGVQDLGLRSGTLLGAFGISGLGGLEDLGVVPGARFYHQKLLNMTTIRHPITSS